MCALRGGISDSYSCWGLVCEGYVICRVEEGNRASGLEVLEWHILMHSSLGNYDECGVMIERVMK